MKSFGWFNLILELILIIELDQTFSFQKFCGLNYNFIFYVLKIGMVKLQILKSFSLNWNKISKKRKKKKEKPNLENFSILYWALDN